MANYQTRSVDITHGNSDQLSKLFSVPRSESGERVSVDTVFGLPAFREGVRQVSTAIGKTDLNCYRTSNNAGRTVDTKHPSHRLLTRKANDWQTSFMWRQTLVSNAMWNGDGYAAIIRGENFQPQAIFNLDSRDVYQFWLSDGYRITETWYSVTSNGKQVLVPAADMIHIRNLGIHTGQEGLGILDSCKMVLGKAIAQHRMSASIFKNGIHSTLICNIPGWLTQEQQEELHYALEDRYTGAANAGRTMLMMGGSSVTTLASTAEEMQLVEAIHASLNDVALICGVPVSMLGGSTASVYGNVQQDRLNFLEITLDAWYTNIETELNSKLLSESEQDTHVIEFDRSSMFATNPDYRKTIIEEWKSKAITWEEMRSRLNESTAEPEPQQPQPVAVAVGSQQPQDGSQPDDFQQDNEQRSEALAEVAGDPQPQGETMLQPDISEEVQTKIAEHSMLRASKLLEATCERLKRRIAKYVNKGNINLSAHHEVIKECLPGFNTTPVIEQLDMLQVELNEVLPEQRQGVISKWDLTPILTQLA